MNKIFNYLRSAYFSKEFSSSMKFAIMNEFKASNKYFYWNLGPNLQIKEEKSIFNLINQKNISICLSKDN